MFKKSKRRIDNEYKNVQKRSLTKIVISIVVAIIIWVGSISFENYLLSDKSMTEVVVVSKTIKEGTIINSKNQGEYFSQIMVNSSLATKETVTDVKNLKGKACIDLEKGTIVSSKMFYDATYINEKFKDPAEITFSAKDVENSVVGTLREGDLIDIIVSKTEPNTGETESTVAYSEVYVIDSYDSNYVKVDSSDKESQAIYFKIYLEREDETAFATMLNEGNITITKVK